LSESLQSWVVQVAVTPGEDELRVLWKELLWPGLEGIDSFRRDRPVPEVFTEKPSLLFQPTQGVRPP